MYVKRWWLVQIQAVDMNATSHEITQPPMDFSNVQMTPNPDSATSSTDVPQKKGAGIERGRNRDLTLT